MKKMVALRCNASVFLRMRECQNLGYRTGHVRFEKSLGARERGGERGGEGGAQGSEERKKRFRINTVKKRNKL